MKCEICGQEMVHQTPSFRDFSFVCPNAKDHTTAALEQSNREKDAKIADLLAPCDCTDNTVCDKCQLAKRRLAIAETQLSAALAKVEELEKDLFHARQAILSEGIRSGDIEVERDSAQFRVKELEGAVAVLREELTKAEERLKWVSDDSESLSFIKSCDAILPGIREALANTSTLFEQAKARIERDVVKRCVAELRKRGFTIYPRSEDEFTASILGTQQGDAP